MLSMVIARETIVTATTQTVREIALEQPALVVDGKVKLYGACRMSMNSRVSLPEGTAP
jgi:hypothetical protein